MAQLVKLRDYISRYEWNIYRYSSQYIRLKQENWQNLFKQWEDRKEDYVNEESVHTEKTSNIERLKAFIQGENLKVKDAGQTQLDFTLPKTKLELKHYFLDKLYPIQLKWASSTVTDVSFMDKRYETDETLKYFLQRFPDTYFLMYYPIFSIKKAPVDCDIILVSPVNIEIIYMLEDDPSVTYMASDERTWAFEKEGKTSRMISPIVSLKRTEGIIRSILKANHMEVKITKVILSRTNPIIFQTEPYLTRIIGKRQYEDWFHEKRNFVSIIKSEQLKVVETLLRFCLTNAVKRPEWEEQPNEFSTD